MMGDAILGCRSLQGRVRAHTVTEGGLWTPTSAFRKNLAVYEWASIVGKSLTTGESKYRIGGMYLEFANVANPGDAVAIPSLDRTRNIEYYNSISASADYLRVALTAGTLTSSDASLYPNGNQMTFFARSSGLYGVRNGLEFGYSANSVIYGASLVAFVDETDFTRDLILSSFYFDVEDQQPKLASSQIGVEWVVTLE